MRTINGHRATRLHGILTLDLEDGLTGTVEIDIDVSDDRCFIDLQSHYEGDDEVRLFRSLLPRRIVSQTISFHYVPAYMLGSEEPEPALTIRVPSE